MTHMHRALATLALVAGCGASSRAPAVDVAPTASAAASAAPEPPREIPASFHGDWVASGNGAHGELTIGVDKVAWRGPRERRVTVAVRASSCASPTACAFSMEGCEVAIARFGPDDVQIAAGDACRDFNGRWTTREAARARRNPSIVILERYAARVCACPDLACAQAASRELAEEASREKPTQVSEQDQRDAEAATNRMVTCMQRLAIGP